MKRCIVFLLVFLLALSVSNAWAGQKITHTVKKGENLCLIGLEYEVSWRKIKKINGLKSTVIRPGQKLIIPKAGKKKIAKESKIFWNVGPGNKLVIHKKNVKKSKSLKISTLKIYRDQDIGRNPFMGTMEKALSLLRYSVEVDDLLKKEVEAGKYTIDFIRSNDRFSMTSGKNKVAQYVAKLKSPLKVKKYQVTFEGKIYRLFYIPACGNWARPPEEKIPPAREEIVPVPQKPLEVPAAPPEEKAPPEEPALPPIFKEEKTRVIYEHELDAGAGLWQNSDNSARGAWWFAQYKFFLHNMEKDLSGGTLTPVIGLFARGDLGQTDADYNWNNWGIGPQAGVMWNGITSKGYPQQVQFMIRAIYEYMHGHNNSSGYNKDEQHALVGYYAEYLRRFHPELMWVLYSEGWVDVSKSFTSTWSGDHASNRTQFTIGAKLHKDWSPQWATRLGFQLGYSPDGNVLGANAHLEFRYNDWLIFGPSLDYNIISDLAAGGWAYGPFARIELHKFVIEKYSVYRAGGVKPADHQLLKY